MECQLKASEQGKQTTWRQLENHWTSEDRSKEALADPHYSCYSSRGNGDHAGNTGFDAITDDLIPVFLGVSQLGSMEDTREKRSCL